MQHQGRIENWNDERGFGFVSPEGGGTRVFVHVNEFSDRRRRPVDGDAIVYEIGLDQENRSQAVNVRFQLSDSLIQTGIRPKSMSSIGIGGVVGITFICLLIVLCVLKIIPVAIPLLYIVMSALTLLAYDLDKAAAQNNRWRTSEKTLQALALVGGWPGALLGQNLFRHKNRKLEFQIVFWFIVCVNCGIFVLAFTDVGAFDLQPLMESMRDQPPRDEKSDLQLPQPVEDDQRLPIIRPLPRSSKQSSN